jgi:hypothetical protein
VSAERALQNLSVIGAIKQRAPLLEFANALWSFLRMQLRHAPVIEEFSAAHGVAEMRSPVIFLVDIHGRRDSTFGHYGMRFAEQRFADHADACTLRQRLDRRAQSCAAGADNQHIMFVRFVRRGHRIRMSLKAPEANTRM